MDTSHSLIALLRPTLRSIASDVHGVRAAIEALRLIGASGVRLDATIPGLRPRELSATALRELRTLCTREGLWVAGVDALLPPDHLTMPEHKDRAVHALLDAIAFTRSVSPEVPLLATRLHGVSADVLSALRRACEKDGVVIADASAPADEAWRGCSWNVLTPVGSVEPLPLSPPREARIDALTLAGAPSGVAIEILAALAGARINGPVVLALRPARTSEDAMESQQVFEKLYKRYASSDTSAFV